MKHSNQVESCADPRNLRSTDVRRGLVRLYAEQTRWARSFRCNVRWLAVSAERGELDVTVTPGARENSRLLVGRLDIEVSALIG